MIYNSKLLYKIILERIRLIDIKIIVSGVDDLLNSKLLI